LQKNRVTFYQRQVLLFCDNIDSPARITVNVQC